MVRSLHRRARRLRLGRLRHLHCRQGKDDRELLVLAERAPDAALPGGGDVLSAGGFTAVGAGVVEAQSPLPLRAARAGLGFSNARRRGSRSPSVPDSVRTDRVALRDPLHAAQAYPIERAVVFRKMPVVAALGPSTSSQGTPKRLVMPANQRIALSWRTSDSFSSVNPSFLARCPSSGSSIGCLIIEAPSPTTLSKNNGTKEGSNWLPENFKNSPFTLSKSKALR